MNTIVKKVVIVNKKRSKYDIEGLILDRYRNNRRVEVEFEGEKIWLIGNCECCEIGIRVGKINWSDDGWMYCSKKCIKIGCYKVDKDIWKFRG